MSGKWPNGLIDTSVNAVLGFAFVITSIILKVVIEINEISMWRKFIGFSALAGVFIGGAALLPVESDTDRRFEGLGDIRVFSEPQASEISAFLIYPYGEGANPFAEGLMHYVEHLVAASVWDVGGEDAMRHSNAWTNQFSTGYWGKGQSQDLPDILQALVQSAAPFDMAPEFASSERKIVQREYDFRNYGQAMTVINREIEDKLYGNQAWSRSVIGTPQDIAQFSYEDAVVLHQRSHRLEDAVLLLFGDVSKGDVFDALEAISTPSVAAVSALDPVDWSIEVTPMRQHAGQSLKGDAGPDVIYRKIVQTSVCGQDFACDVRLGLLENILDSAMEGGIAGPLRFDAFLAQSFRFHLAHLGQGQVEISFSASLDEGVSRKELLSTFESTLEDRLTSGFLAESFERVKKRGLLGANDKLFSAKQKFDAALSWAQSGMPIPGLLAENRVYDAITLEELNGLARELAATGRVVVRNLY